jgi:hypothetical protein
MEVNLMTPRHVAYAYDAQCKKAMTRLTALKRVQREIPRKSQFTLFVSFIRPILVYGWQLYDNSSKKALSKLEKVQRDALLSLTRAYVATSHIALLKETGVEPLSSRRERGKKLFMYEHSANLPPNYLNMIIPDKVNTKNDYSLRTNDNINIPVSKKNYYRKSFITSAIKSWNELDLQLRKSSSYDSFKSTLKKVAGNFSYNMYLFRDCSGAINHSRIRMGLSGRAVLYVTRYDSRMDVYAYVPRYLTRDLPSLPFSFLYYFRADEANEASKANKASRAQ